MNPLDRGCAILYFYKDKSLSDIIKNIVLSNIVIFFHIICVVYILKVFHTQVKIQFTV